MADIYGTAGHDSLMGTPEDDRLFGFEDNDFLNGAAGADTMAGGPGNDIYDMDDVGDVVVELAGEGENDLVMSTVSYTLPDNVETIMLMGPDPINATGNDLNNGIYGNEGANILDGGGGVDAIFGGAGDDTYIVNELGDFIFEDSGGGIDTVVASIDFVAPYQVENLTLVGSATAGGGNDLDNRIVGNELDNQLGGGLGNDTLVGGAGNDQLDGYWGADTMIGGQGDDTYSVDDPGDAVIEAAREGIDTVEAGVSYTLPDNVESLTLTYSLTGPAEAGTGNNLDNVITGNYADNTLDGGPGNDTLFGGYGNDVLVGGPGADLFYGGEGDDQIFVDAEDVFADGGPSLLDTLTVQGLGAYLTTTDVERIFGSEGNDTITAIGFTSFTTMSGFGGDDVLTGGDGSDTLNGGDGNDRLIGGGASDLLIGGAGNDTYVVDNPYDQVVESPGEGIDTVESSASAYALPSDVENLILTGTAVSGTGNEWDNTIIGDDGDNVLIGGQGNDLLDGGLGADRMDGGPGDDTYVVDNAGDVVIEYMYGGTDEVQSSISYTLPNDAENLTLTGTGNIDGTGNELDNVLIGNAGNNTITGGAGADELYGGDGDDSLYIDAADSVISGGAGQDFLYVQGSQGVTVDLGQSGVEFATGGVGNDTFTTSTADAIAVFAGDGNDTLIGGSGGDTLYGDAGDDVISGGAGMDSLFGGYGNDSIDGGADTDLIEGGEGDDLLNGGAGSDLLYGDGGNDTLIGGDGIDYLYGGTGNDTYVTATGLISIVESPGEGIDTVQSGVGFTLGENLENLILTGTAPISGIGNSLDNVLTGNGAANVLDGGAGGDRLIGGDGNDMYEVDSGGDVVVENADEGTDTVESTISYTLGSDVENLTLLGTAVSGTGNALNNVIMGNSAANTLRGGAGGDVLTGGAGNDTLYGDAGADQLLAGDGDDTLYFDGNDTVDGGAGNDYAVVSGDMLTPVTMNLTTAGIETVSGGDGNDTFLASGSGVVSVDGGKGNDSFLSSGSGTAYVSGGDGDDTITGGFGNDQLVGDAGNDIIRGGLGDDTIAGNAGSDLMYGDGGNDYFFIDAFDKVDGGQGYDIAEMNLDDPNGATLDMSYSSLEEARGGAGNDVFVTTGYTAVALFGNRGDDILGGGYGNDILNGGDGNDNLTGGPGNDWMFGGAGDDVYLVDNPGDSVTEYAGEGTDTVQSAATYTLTANVENLTLIGGNPINGTGNSLANVLIGNSEANTLMGGAGNDILDGGGGIDGLFGGQGDDLYYVDNTSDVVGEAVNEGIDTVRSSVTYSIGVEVENLTLTGSAGINGTGSSLNNTLVGNSGANVLDGGAGNDTMSGGQGDDTYVVDASGDVVTELANEGTDAVQSAITYTLGANLENLTLTGSGAINGTGNALDNVLTGNSAANVLTGGAGNDTYVVGTGDSIVENANAGIDAVQSSITWTLGANLENLTLTGTSAINGTGNTLDNVLTGNSAANVLSGGAGNDTYLVSSGDTVSENNNGGTDTVKSDVTWTLGSNIENLTLLGSANINGTGNSLSNIMTGNSGANTLDGDSGADVMTGLAGDDTYLVDNTGDSVVEAAGGGIDTVQSSVTYTLAANVENLVLTGNSAINGTGNALGNVLTGNSKANVLTGGAGDDTYIVSSGDSTVENANEGIDTVQSSGIWSLAANVENLILTGTSAINGTGNTSNNTLTGNSAANTLSGGAGDDVLDGGAGADTLIGGTGNDTYVRDNTGDTITENANEGIDTVQSSLTYTLGPNLENLTLTGSSAINGTGNTLNNTLLGNSANNVLTGLSGNDTYLYNRGGGQDTVVDNSGASDALLLGPTINPLDLVLSRQANDLRIAIHGTTDQITIANWYTSPTTNQIEDIQAGNGQHLANTQVNQLIQAMASFSQQTGLSWDQAIDQRPQDVQTVLAASWQ